MQPRDAGLVYGPMLHHLDHVAPFCALQEIPLIVTEAAIEEAARRYYPGLQVIFWDYLEATHQLVSRFDRIFTTLPRPIFDDAFFAGQMLQGKKIPTVWLPHGNSDKGRLTPLMEGLVHETDALVYGRKMIDFMKEKNVFAHLQSCSSIGNYRLRYFQKHADFYRRLVDPLLDPSKKTILYAPTWRDEEGSCSLDAAWPHLAAGLPSGFQLAVKLHPNIQDVFEESSAVFLNDFPPVYPLLERADVYIGDMSSIGYDFLALDRPMFFLNTGRRDRQKDPGLYLLRCGVEVRPEEFSRIYEIIEENMDQAHLSTVRKKVYDYTFDCRDSCKTPFGSTSALLTRDSDFSQIAYSHSSMSICEKSEPGSKSSNLASEASFARPSVKRLDMRAAAIHTGPDTYLDHLGVLAAILEIPLLLTEPKTFEAAKKFYPQADASLCDLADLSIPFLAENFDAIFESGHLWAAEMLPLFELLCGKKMRMVYVPHGNSDKGHSTLAVPKDVSLVYGRHMLDLLEKSGGLSSYAITGNYRSWFYRRHKPFYDDLLQKKIGERLRGKKTLLYAPTWADGENPTSFFSSCEQLISEASPHFDLIVKLHPFLEERSPAETWKIISRCQDTPGAIILNDFPAIYPILDFCDGYVGDFSSIGYDFLGFRKPMFFLEKNDGALKNCGQTVPKNRDIGRFILDFWNRREELFLEEQKRVYAYAFGEELESLELNERIKNALSIDRAW